VDALAQRPERAEVEVENVTISYRAWGAPNHPGVLLVHGAAAHARWWDHLAPLLAPDRRVVAIDMSGHGDSGHRGEYPLDIWADELMTVVEHGGIAGPPTIIGHSMGGLATLRAADRFGDRLAGVIAVDSPIRTVTAAEESAIRSGLFRPRKTYQSRGEIVDRFRLVPRQDHLPYVSSHVAQNSVRESEAGWVWKFDPKMFLTPAPSWDLLGRLNCRVALLRGEHGLITPDMARRMQAALGGAAPMIEIPAAGHAIMVDQPLALLAALRTVLAIWE
jgi:pimeloyl-ACP methyl ester carboxylesterase